MSIPLESKELVNTQQMEVAVNGPDGATHLILCTGVANVEACATETFTFFVGPPLSRRQFVGAIASGALSTIQGRQEIPTGDAASMEWAANLVSIDAIYDDEANQVKVRTGVVSSKAMTKLAISYNVSILAELPDF